MTDFTWFLQQLEGDLAELEAKNEASKDNVAKITRQLQPIRERLQDIGQRYDKIYKVQTKIGECHPSFRVLLCG